MSEQYELWVKPLADETRDAVRYTVEGKPVIFDNRPDADRAAKHMNRVSIHRYFSKEIVNGVPDLTPAQEARLARVLHGEQAAPRMVQNETNLAAGIADGRKGAKLAAEHADLDWLRDAYDAGVACASDYVTFTTDEIWALLTRSDGKEWHPNGDSRAMGQIIRQLKSDGIIEATGEYRLSKRRSVHGSPSPVYRRGKGKRNV